MKKPSRPVEMAVYAMRHGQKDGDQLTERGAQQVIASVRAHLPNNPVRAIWYSPTVRTQQTAEAAIGAVSGIIRPILLMVPDLGYEWAMSADWNEGLYAKVDKDMADELKRKPTALDWLQHATEFPPVALWRLAMQKVIAAAGREALENGTSATVLLAGHDPLVGLAAPEGCEIGVIGLADIVRYTVEVHPNYAVLDQVVEAAHLRCPLT